MSWENVPWFVGGGAEHSPEVMRLALYASTGGAEGIVAPQDLRVRPLTVPGLGVRIDTGSALLLNRSPGASQQTYAVRKPVQETVGDDLLSATGGSARSDLVVVRVEDPQYAPWQDPPDPQHGPYVFTHVIEGVPSDTLTAAELNLGYPAIALARIDRPASTGTIEAQHIVDLRRVAIPRRKSDLFTHALTSGQEEIQNSTSSAGEAWPNVGTTGWLVDVPEWATYVDVVGTWSQVRVPAGYAVGELWARVGGSSDPDAYEIQRTVYSSPNSDRTTRSTFRVAARAYVAQGLRGRRIPVYLCARLTNGAPSAERIRLDASSAVDMQLEFHEIPD